MVVWLRATRQLQGFLHEDEQVKEVQEPRVKRIEDDGVVAYSNQDCIDKEYAQDKGPVNVKVKILKLQEDEDSQEHKVA
jgi:hypothetical protein